MRKLVALMLAAAASISIWQCQSLAISEGGAIFLLIRPGARACGMGSAFAAVADDASATYFNPAGLAYLKVGSAALSVDDVKNWPRVLDSFRESDSTYLLTGADLRDPGELMTLVLTSPLATRGDVKDWHAALAGLADTVRPAVRGLRAALTPELLAIVDQAQPDSALSDDNKTQVIRALNGLLNKNGLYRQVAFGGIDLPPAAQDLLKRTIADTLCAENITDPAGFWARLKQVANPLARYLYAQLPEKLKAQGNKLKAGDKADPAWKTALAAELNKLLRKPDLAQPARLKGLALSEATLKLAGQKLADADVVRFNRALLLEAFAPALGLVYDSGKLLMDETRIVNRWLLEAVLGDALIPYQKRQVAVTFNEYLRTKLSAELEQLAKDYDGTRSIAGADARPLVDGINRLLAQPDFFQEERFKAVTFSADAKRMIDERLTAGLTIKLNRVLLEESYAGMLQPVKDKVTAHLHIKGLLGPVSQDILAQYFQGKTITKQVKKRLIDDLNAVIAGRQLYQVAVFAPYKLPEDAQELVNAGLDNLTKEQLLRLNRRLLEAVYPADLTKMKTDMRYATLMHSPWLSEIWKDVGDMYYEFIGYAQPVKDWGVFGGNVVFLSEGQNWHTGINGEDLGVFSSYEFSPCLSYGNKIYENLAGGINLKLIHSHLAPFGAAGTQGKGIATTWAIDLGALYKGPVKGLSIGVNVQNLGPKLVYISAEQADPLSRNIRGGLAYRILDGKSTRLTAAFDLTKTIVYLNQPWRTELKEAVQHWGMEYWYLGPANLALRSGYVYDYVGNIIGPTFGFGVGYKFAEFDFSMEPGGDLQKYNRKFSLSVNF